MAFSMVPRAEDMGSISIVIFIFFPFCTSLRYRFYKLGILKIWIPLQVLLLARNVTLGLLDLNLLVSKMRVTRQSPMCLPGLKYMDISQCLHMSGFMLLYLSVNV